MGSASSGNFGHKGRPGEVGGSAGVGDRVFYRTPDHIGGMKSGRIISKNDELGTATIDNDITREHHEVAQGDISGKTRVTSAAIWNKEGEHMRVNPGTKAPGKKVAEAAGRVKVGNNMEEGTTSEGHKVLYSYGTPVAAKIVGDTAYQTDKKWSTTTSSHIRKWAGSDLPTKPQAFFDDLGSGKGHFRATVSEANAGESRFGGHQTSYTKHMNHLMRGH
jgi:hypothetical protein